MPRSPKYCHHKAKNLAYVRIQGKMIYLGEYDSPVSREAYDAEILKWRQTNDVSGKHSTTIGQLCLAFIEHAEKFYRDEVGDQTGEANNFRKCLRLLVEQFRNVPCSQFGPKKLHELQQAYIKSGRVRKQINKAISRVKSVFRWGVAQEMIPADVVTALDCVRDLQKGRSDAIEGKPVLPVPERDFAEVLPMMTAKVSAMCRLLYHTGARVSEIRTMRVCDIDTTGDVWFYNPSSHKNAWRGKDRTIPIGPKGQAVLMPFIADAVHEDLFVFRPRVENEPYTLQGFGSSIRKACKRAGVDHWSPGQLRHNTATNINRETGDADASRVLLGQDDIKTTQIYIERNLQKATEIAKQFG